VGGPGGNIPVPGGVVPSEDSEEKISIGAVPQEKQKSIRSSNPRFFSVPKELTFPDVLFIAETPNSILFMKNTTSEIYEILWFVKGDTISDICHTSGSASQAENHQMGALMVYYAIKLMA